MGLGQKPINPNPNANHNFNSNRRGAFVREL